MIFTAPLLVPRDGGGDLSPLHLQVVLHHHGIAARREEIDVVERGEGWPVSRSTTMRSRSSSTGRNSDVAV